jgi:hypothetical protein
MHWCRLGTALLNHMSQLMSDERITNQSARPIFPGSKANIAA